MALTAGVPPDIADILALVQASSGKPLVRLVQQAAQSIASATDVAITFGAGSEDVDTHGFHDTSTNTTRVTPTVPGWYRLNGTVWMAADTDVINLIVGFGRNGSQMAPKNRLVLQSTATASIPRSFNATAMLSANGTTDYFELYVAQQQAAAAALNTLASGSTSSVFEVEYLRPL